MDETSLSPTSEEDARTGAVSPLLPAPAAPVAVEPAPEAHPDFRAGTAALAAMPDDEFEVRLVAMRRGRERITRIHRELMDPETDYGVIPGTRQPTLLKPGAEKLCDFYRLAAEFQPQITYGDGEQAPPITVVTECRLHLGTLVGPVVNTGHGAANSWEKRYRYRRGERTCPACGKVGTIVKGRAEYGGGWLCFAKKGGCGAKWPDEAPEIVDQPVGDIENPDPYDLLNTLLKISEKRSYVDAVLRATATSGLYTQDIEEADAERSNTEARRHGGEGGTASLSGPIGLPGMHAAEAIPAGSAATGREPPSVASVSPCLRAASEAAPREPPSLKAAYEAFLAAMTAAGLDRRDTDAAKRLMQAVTGRRSSRVEPYTPEEFLRAAAQLGGSR